MSTPQPIQGMYQVKDRPGAHLVRNLRDLDGVVTVEVLLIGSAESHQIGYETVSHWDRVLATDVQPYTPAAAYTTTGPADLVALAQEAVTVYALDPARVQRAAQIVLRRFAIVNARKDENGIDIPRPSLNALAIESDARRGWYVVRPGTCTCKDHQQGNTCKHRIAAWIHRESIIRPLAAARRVSKTQILAELTA